jgi:CHAT domain-containing protein
VGQGDEVLGVYAGMAEAFLFAGASAVVAPIWSVDDKVAHDIALSFYQATLRDGGDTPAAEVLRRERAKFTRDQQAATYLSYQFFGHPEMRLRLRK